MNPAPCAKLKAFVELGLQGLVQSTRMALRHAPADELTAFLPSELLNLGLWEPHLGAEMMSRATYEVPQDGYREASEVPTTRPRAAPEAGAKCSKWMSTEVDTDEEWQLCNGSRSGALALLGKPCLASDTAEVPRSRSLSGQSWQKRSRWHERPSVE